MEKIEIPGYSIKKKIGEGSFGEVFKATKTDTGFDFAIKVESIESKIRFLEFESRIYKHLMKSPVHRENGIPKMFEFGKTKSHYFLVIELLGNSLETKHEKGPKGIFGVFNSLIAAMQILEILEFVHENSIIHRDVKPDNFVVGVGTENYKVFALDFGLSKRFIDSEGNHIPFRNDKDIMGTLRFASINTHKGHELSRRDDLESLSYNMVYLAKGTLPWISVRAKNQREMVEEIHRKKVYSPPKEIAKGLPSIFSDFIEYTRGLSFEERPAYSKWIKSIQFLIEREFGIPNELAYFDWVKSPPVKKTRSRRGEDQDLGEAENEILKFLEKKSGSKKSVPEIQKEESKSDSLINKTLVIPKMKPAPRKKKPIPEPKPQNFKEKLKQQETSVFIPRIVVHKNLNR